MEPEKFMISWGCWFSASPQRSSDADSAAQTSIDLTQPASTPYIE
jgi:hypothetical protein